jgi:plasmid stabilization system protein ParE
MPRVRVDGTPRARADLRRIHEQIAHDFVRSAARLARKLEQAVERPKNFPELGGLVAEAEEFGRREIIHGSYRIIYRYRGDTVLVVNVWHAARPLVLRLLED